MVVGIMCMGLLLLSTFLLYSISQQQDRGELDTVLVDFAAGKHRCSLSTCHMLCILQQFHDLAAFAEAPKLSSRIRLLAGQHMRQYKGSGPRRKVVHAHSSAQAKHPCGVGQHGRRRNQAG